jgi:uncharacterized protein
MERLITPFVEQDLDKKIVLISGPRQVGKTTLAKSICRDSQSYLSFDRAEDRKVIQTESWSRLKNLTVFDELHKMKNWKRWLKGIYDTDGVRPRILVTGSARFNVYRRTGDSLAGRHFAFRLHPFTVREIGSKNPEATVNALLKLGGFPEPFLDGRDQFAAKWRKSHFDVILREDLLDLETVRNIKSIEILASLLSERVGSPISYSSLARDLQVAPQTVKRWIEILESLYVVFLVRPYSKNIAKSILKEPKVYFYDTGRVQSGEGGRLENLVATHLLKRNDFLEDTSGETMSLFYVKNKDKHEVDFLTVRNGKTEYLVEVKKSDTEFSKSLLLFSERLKPIQSVQVVQELEKDRSLRHPVEVEMLSVGKWLAQLES